MPTNATLKVSAVMPASPKQVYEAWLDGKQHAAMTGSPARVSAREGEAFRAWDGYISGRNLKLVRNRRIVQAWRSTEFPEGAPDSELEVTLTRSVRGTRVTVKHSRIPGGQRASYLKGWKEFYFEPMKRFFSATREPGRIRPRR